MSTVAVSPDLTSALRLDHLRALEAESIHILREVVAEFERPVMLYSIGKDSSVLLRLAQTAFCPGPIPFALHVDTTYKFREMIRFRVVVTMPGEKPQMVKCRSARSAARPAPARSGSDANTVPKITDPVRETSAHHTAPLTFAERLAHLARQAGSDEEAAAAVRKALEEMLT